MVAFTDEFLNPETFAALQQYCLASDFAIVDAGGKEFSVLPVPETLYPLLEKEGHEIVLSFIREARPDFDTDLRIHADNIINGKRTSLASVLYINPEEGVTPSGTAFYRHETYGEQLPEVSNEEFDRLITEDSNDPVKWEKINYVEAKPNRMLTYDSQLFHSKYPAQIERGRRIVLVCFYTKITA